MVLGYLKARHGRSQDGGGAKKSKMYPRKYAAALFGLAVAVCVASLIIHSATPLFRNRVPTLSNRHTEASLHSVTSDKRRQVSSISLSPLCAKWVHRQCRWAFDVDECMHCVESSVRAAKGTVGACSHDTVGNDLGSSQKSRQALRYCESSRVQKRTRPARVLLHNLDARGRGTGRLRHTQSSQKFVALFAMWSGTGWPSHVSLFEWGIVVNPHIDVYLVGPELPRYSLCRSLPNCFHLCTDPITCGVQAKEHAPCARVRRHLGTPCHPRKHRYALSDLKPLLGVIYPEIVRRYEFWGWSDVDVIWGHLSMLTPTRLVDVNLVHPLARTTYTTCGAFMLLRTELAPLVCLTAWKAMVQEPNYTVFDEWWGPFHTTGDDFGSVLEWVTRVRPHHTTSALVNAYDNRDYGTPGCKWCALAHDIVEWFPSGRLWVTTPTNRSSTPVDLFHFIDLKYREHWKQGVSEWVLQIETTPAHQRLAMVRRTCARWRMGVGGDEAVVPRFTNARFGPCHAVFH